MIRIVIPKIRRLMSPHSHLPRGYRETWYNPQTRRIVAWPIGLHWLAIAGNFLWSLTFYYPKHLDKINLAWCQRQLQVELDSLIAAGTTKIRLDYDADYGINHRTGWSIHVDGMCLSQFQPTAVHAVEQAKEYLKLVAEQNLSTALDKHSSRGNT